MNLEKQKAFLIHFLYFALIIGIAFLSIKYIMPLLMPFVIGLFVAALLRPTIDVIAKKTHLKRSFVSIFILLVFYSVIALLTLLVSAKAFYFLQDIFNRLPSIYTDVSKSIQPELEKLTENVLLQYPDIEDYLEDIFNSIGNSLFSVISTASTTVVGTITGLAGQVPSILINFLFTIVSSFFFTIDYHRIANFVMKQFSKEKQEMILNIKNSIIKTLGKFAKAYVTLILITFTELSIGFIILHIPNPMLIGGIVAIVDILPILGTGAVLLPWAIIAFIFGKNAMAIGILILYIVVTIVRQTLEPKVVGRQIGLHPVVTLLCIFAGAQLLGVVGLLLLPITVTIIKQMNDEGTIHLFK